MKALVVSAVKVVDNKHVPVVSIIYPGQKPVSTVCKAQKNAEFGEMLRYLVHEQAELMAKNTLKYFQK